MRAALPTWLALAALVFGPARALAHSASPPAPPSGGVRAGAEVVTAIPPLPAGAEEFELVLVPESGPAVQVSPELPAGATEVRWRVPRVYARSARLVLRWGGPGFEAESEPSAPFALGTPDAADLADLIGLRSDALRWPEYASGPASGLAPVPPRPEWVATPSAIRAITPQAPDALAPPACLPGTLAFRDASHETAPAAEPRPRAPVFRPLRN